MPVSQNLFVLLLINEESDVATDPSPTNTERKKFLKQYLTRPYQKFQFHFRNAALLHIQQQGFGKDLSLYIVSLSGVVLFIGGCIFKEKNATSQSMCFNINNRQTVRSGWIIPGRTN
ncbi:hypothetical protein D3H55_21650 [Bacillus salacetis]|uniref:Uncharacterized protein n=1 Tax=Bacillus salacetis TaxID=2315464 RepID=A0A3A1QN91_9BACI|nr:hypothetical protein D3H55_21650 [Bacillus salacetis]